MERRHSVALLWFGQHELNAEVQTLFSSSSKYKIHLQNVTEIQAKGSVFYCFLTQSLLVLLAGLQAVFFVILFCVLYTSLAHNALWFQCFDGEKWGILTADIDRATK